MEEYLLFVFSLFILNVVALPPSNQMQYRTDYEYNKKTNAFFKLHIDTNHLTAAHAICRLEGAELLVPRTEKDIAVAHAMFKRYPDLGQYLMVGDDGKNHESAEEEPLINLRQNSQDLSDIEDARYSSCDILTRQGKIEQTHCYRVMPYICKVEANAAVYDSQCDVYARDYQYIQSAGSCYRVPPFDLEWNEAEAECRAQGAHLIIINSATEYEAIVKFLKTAPRLKTALVDYYYLAGFIADRSANREFRTIFNQSLPEAGFATWQDGEPNNFEGREYCGALFRSNGKYNDVDCNQSFAFICEKEIPLKS